MDALLIQRCLDLLREADGILMDHDELATAVHLSLVIETLEHRLKG